MKNNQEIITLSGENGKNMEFELIAEIAYLEYNYLILKPVKSYQDMAADEAIVFRVEVTPDGDIYEIEQDDEIICAIEEIYNSEI